MVTSEGPAALSVWLLSSYRSDSHAAWAAGLTGHLQELDWRVRELPGRHFAWRIRGNPLSWLDELPRKRPDLILATSMVDLATIKGLHPRVADVPAVYYFHENQFAYPRSGRQITSIEAQMVQIYGALAAERVLFNSEWNRGSFFDGLAALLDELSDHVPAGLRERLEDASEVLAVPVEPVPAAPDRDARLIVWNHRWQHDKAPELFAEAMLELARRGFEFRLALLGRRPTEPPEALTRLRRRLGDRIVADGYARRGEYDELLGRAGIAVSTAHHEFQGVAMLEAASAGARPLVPDALCYPEQYSRAYRYPLGDTAALVERLGRWLEGGLPPLVDVSEWTSERLIARWRDVLAGQARARPGSRG